MSVEEHLRDFHGLRVFDFPPPQDERLLPDASAVAWRLAVDVTWGPDYRRSLPEAFAEKWERFLRAVDASQVQAVVIGA